MEEVRQKFVLLKHFVRAGYARQEIKDSFAPAACLFEGVETREVDANNEPRD